MLGISQAACAACFLAACSGSVERTPADGQIGAETYTRAEALMGPNLVHRVYNQFIGEGYIIRRN